MTATVTLQFQSTGTIPGSGEPVRMRGPSLTIGRGAENDLVLPDPDRTLSKRHCAIEDHNGNVLVLDMSTNGTFLNYGKLPLGTVPTPLNDGDILSLGPYEILVSIRAEGAADPGLPDPLADGPVSYGQADAAPSLADLLDAPSEGGDFLDDLLGSREAPVGPSGVRREEPDEDGLLPPLGEDADPFAPAPDPYAGQGASRSAHAPATQDHFSAPRPATGGSAIPDDWDEDFLRPTPRRDDPFAAPEETAPPSGGAAAFIPDDFGLDDLGPPDPATPAPVPPHPTVPPAPVSRPPEPTAAEPVETPPDPSASPAEPAPEPPAAPAASDSAAARAFLRSLGAEEVRLDPADLKPTLSRMGHVLRIMIDGLREILMTRTSIKSEFRIEQTRIKSGGNNPLKFSISPEQAIEAMVRPSAKGYLDATVAAEEALRDIKAHEVAVITGMESALKGVLRKLDPKVLEERIATGGGLSGLLKSRKARYWEVYEAMYAEISDQAENDFHELFAREFARAYQEQLDRLK